MKLHGQRDVAKFLARALIDRGIDMSYAYKPLHDRRPGARLHQHAAVSRLGP